MNKFFLTYGLSTALNRASHILFLPLATHALSLADFGTYSLAVIFSQLSFPFFCLNGHAAVTREGAADTAKGRRLLSSFSLINIALLVVFISASQLFPLPIWIYFGAIMGGLESLHQMMFSYLRITEKLKSYMAFTLLKSILLGSTFLLVMGRPEPLADLLLMQLVVYGVLSLFIFPLSGFKISDRIKVSPYLGYCLFLLPAGISQWVISSSDRLVIKATMTDVDVGLYSIAYNIALMVMVVNSGVALAVPQLIFKDYENWLDKTMRLKVMMKIVAVSLLVYVGLMVGAKIDSLYFHLIDNFTADLFPVIAWICAGLVVLSFYYIYSNVIFYKKKTQLLTTVALFTAALNIGLTILFTQRVGIVGAAIATFISYVFFTGSTYVFAKTVEKRLVISKWEPALLAASLGFIFGFSYLF